MGYRNEWAGLTPPITRHGLDLRATIYCWVFQLLIILFISRLLGPEGAGVYVVVLLLPTLLSQLLNLGLAPANVFFVASEQFDLTQVWAANRNIVLAMSLFGLAIGCAIVHFVGATIFRKSTLVCCFWPC